MHNKFIKQNAVYSPKSTFAYTVAGTNILESRFAVSPAVGFGDNPQAFPAMRAVDQSCKQGVGLSVRAVVFLGNIVQHILRVDPFLT